MADIAHPPTPTPRRRARPLRAVRGVGLGLLCALAAWALTATPLTRGVEDWLLDGLFFYRGARPTDAKVVIIGLDEPSLRGLDKPLVYISPELAAVVGMAADRGAAAVGIDLFVP